MNPIVSIIMPCYNASDYLRQAIESVQAQTFKAWELLVVDDCSQDNTLELIETYKIKDERIKLIALANNVGVANARNKGIANATGQYIAFLDSDDVWLANKLEKQIAQMQATKVALCYSSYRIIDENGCVTSCYNIPRQKVSYKDMLRGSVIGNLTAIYDCQKVGKVYLRNIGHEDYVLWLDILKKTDYALGIDEVLAEYRICSTSLSANKLKASMWQWNIYRNIEKLGFFYSVYLFLQYAYKGLIKY